MPRSFPVSHSLFLKGQKPVPLETLITKAVKSFEHLSVLWREERPVASDDERHFQ